MKSMPPRSPSRRNSPPPPPRITHRSPAFRNRGRSPDRRRRMEPQGGGGRGMSPPRSRERREFNRHSPRRGSLPQVHMMRPSQPPEFPLPRRSRSPIRESKRRSFSPKRKISPKRERERERGREPERDRASRSAMGRKRSRSKSPPVAVGPVREAGPRMGPYNVGPPEVSPQGSRGYAGPSDPYPPTGPVLEVAHRPLGSLGERFRAAGGGGGGGGGNYEEERAERPVFRGPDGTGYDINELKKITVDIRRNLPVVKAPAVERNIINPEDVVVVRRPDMMGEMGYAERDTSRGRNRSPSTSRRKQSSWEREAANHFSNERNNKSEGARPIFARDEIIQANDRSKYEAAPSPYEHRSGPTDEHHRVVAIVDNPPQLQSSGGPRFESPGRYPVAPSHSREPYYPGGGERDYGRPPREYERSHGPVAPNFDSREKGRDDRFDSRRGEDLRHDLELRRRDDTRYSGHGDNVRTYEKGRDYRGDSDRNSSDLRIRINEKRTDRHDEREPGHHRMMDRREGMERDNRDRRPMMQPSPPGDRRRAPPPMEGFSHSGGEERHKMRGDGGRIPPMSHHGGAGPGGRREENLPDRFHHPEPHPAEFGGHRPDRFHANKPWDVNPEYVPKGRAYFEHDNRDDEMMRVPGRGRGPMGPRGPMRSRGTFRGRPFRGGGPRGFIRGARRGGYSPRFKPSSPHWEHDLFDNAAPEGGNNGLSK